MPVVTEDRVHHHERLVPSKSLNKTADDLDLTRRAHIPRVDRVEIDAEFFPLINDFGHLFGEIQKREVRVLRVIGKNCGWQRTHVKAHGRENRNDGHQRRPADSGQIVNRRNAAKVGLETHVEDFLLASVVFEVPKDTTSQDVKHLHSAIFKNNRGCASC